VRELVDLPGPYEIFDVGDGESVELRIKRYDQGEMIILPKGATVGKRIQVLRLHLETPIRPGAMPYLDVTSKTLQAQLGPLIAAPQSPYNVYKITKHGVAPSARFTVEVRT
jgi:hypothetical protein